MLSLPSEDETNFLPPTAPSLPANKKYHVFFSHSSRGPDSVWVVRLQEFLESHGYKICFHERDFTPGMSIYQNIEEAVRLSLKTVAVLSPRYCESRWCKLEAEMTMVYSIQKRKSILLPVLVEDCDIPEHLKVLTFIDVRGPLQEWLPQFLSALSEVAPIIDIPSLPVGKKYHAFFLYRKVSPDKDWVFKVVSVLENSEIGFKCGYHERDFVGGKTIFENISDCMKMSQNIFIVLSPAFLESVWARYETDFLKMLTSTGKEADLAVIPILLEECKVPEGLKDLTYLDVRGMEDNWWPRLLTAVGFPVEEAYVLHRTIFGRNDAILFNEFSAKTDRDKVTPGLYDVAFTVEGNVLVTDYANKKLKKFSLNGHLEAEMIFSNSPTCIGERDSCTFAITFNQAQYLKLVDVRNTMCVIRKVPVPSQCFGVATISPGSLAVVSQHLPDLSSLLIVSTVTNDIQRDITHSNTGNRLFWSPGFVDVSADGALYLTDPKGKRLVILRVSNTPFSQGEVVCQTKQLSQPEGLRVFQEKVYVASENIMIFRFDGTPVGEICLKRPGKSLPRGISISGSGKYLAVTYMGENSDMISIYSIN